jgi:hypothetical protein
LIPNLLDAVAHSHGDGRIDWGQIPFLNSFCSKILLISISLAGGDVFRMLEVQFVKWLVVAHRGKVVVIFRRSAV